MKTKLTDFYGMTQIVKCYGSEPDIDPEDTEADGNGGGLFSAVQRRQFSISVWSKLICEGGQQLFPTC